MQSRLFLLLLKPSFISLVGVFTAAFILIIAVNGSYFTYNEALFPVLYGEFGAITAIERSPALIEGLVDGFGTNPILYSIVVTLTALIAGWILFHLVRAIKRGGQAFEAVDQHTVKQRAVARVSIGCMWILFCFLTINFLLPLCLLYSRIGAEIIMTGEGALISIITFISVVIIFHIHIVFARLFLLKPRVFGGKNIVQEASFPLHRSN